MDNNTPEVVKDPVIDTPATEEAEVKGLATKTKAELLEYIEKQELKYKKLLTAKQTVQTKLDETTDTIEQLNKAVGLLNTAVDMANTEAANMSENLRKANANAKYYKAVLRNQSVAINLALENSAMLVGEDLAQPEE